jgi:hypothetical protein
MKDDTPPMCAGCQRADVRPGRETSAEDTIDLMAFCDAVKDVVLAPDEAPSSSLDAVAPARMSVGLGASRQVGP